MGGGVAESQYGCCADSHGCLISVFGAADLKVLRRGCRLMQEFNSIYCFGVVGRSCALVVGETMRLPSTTRRETRGVLQSTRVECVSRGKRRAKVR